MRTVFSVNTKNFPAFRARPSSLFVIDKISYTVFFYADVKFTKHAWTVSITCFTFNSSLIHSPYYKYSKSHLNVMTVTDFFLLLVYFLYIFGSRKWLPAGKSISEMPVCKAMRAGGTSAGLKNKPPTN